MSELLNERMTECYKTMIKMKAIFLFIGLFFSSFLVAQNASDLGLLIYQPSSSVELNEAQKTKLEQRVLSIFTNNGVVNGRSSIFAVKSSFDVLENNTVEGMKSMQVVQAELTLVVENRISGHTLNSLTKKLTGSGNTTSIAIQKAINSIRSQQVYYQNFIKRIEKNINNFYTNECANQLAEAEQANKQQNYAKAIAILHAIPRQTDCFEEAETALNPAYFNYQKQQCQQHLQGAKIAMTKREFSTVLEELALIDVDSPCSSEAVDLLEQVGEGLDEQLAAKQRFLYKVHTENLLLEKARIQAMDGIGKAYLQTIEGQDIIIK